LRAGKQTSNGGVSFRLSNLQGACDRFRKARIAQSSLSRGIVGARLINDREWRRSALS
jgi:hypothetical protein